MPVAYSILPVRINSVIASMSGAGGRSSTSIGTCSRTAACARIRGAELLSGAKYVLRTDVMYKNVNGVE